ncbi:MAG: HAD hydrolase-like protein, partial [Paracoccaceae bacterium]|nr:HAD hydrolase-like protein [Paracoccaceae bacterium]
FGKPHPPIYDLARRRLSALAASVGDDEILAVGDGIATDVQGGLSEGIDTLFVTEGLAAGLFGPDSTNLNKDLLAAWLTAQQRDPTYSIGHLR